MMAFCQLPGARYDLGLFTHKSRHRTLAHGSGFHEVYVLIQQRLHVDIFIIFYEACILVDG
jgi:hypothetical protein